MLKYRRTGGMGSGAEVMSNRREKGGVLGEIEGEYLLCIRN